MKLRPTYNIQDAFKAMPKAYNKTVIVGTGGLKLTVKEILKLVSSYSHTVKDLAKILKGDTEKQTSFNIWHFLRSQIYYKEDKIRFEELRTPARLFYDKIGDCDDFSIFASSILKELGYKPFFFIVAFENNINYGHIYVGFNNQIVDAVMSEFDQHPDKITKFKTVQLNGKELVFKGSPKTTNYMKIAVLNGTSQYSKNDILAILEGDPHRDIIEDVFQTASISGTDIIYENEELAELAETYFDKLEHTSLNGLGSLKSWYKKTKKKIITQHKKKVALTKKIIKKVNNSKVMHYVRRVNWAPFRTAYLGLLRLNFLGHARKLTIGYYSGSKAKRMGLDCAEWMKLQKARKKFVSFWIKAGGREKDIVKAINTGRTKRAIDKHGRKAQGLGEAIAIGAEVTGAGTIIGVITNYFKNIDWKKLYKNVKPALKKIGSKALKKYQERKNKEANEGTPEIINNETTDTPTDTKTNSWLMPALGVGAGILILTQLT